MRWYQVRDLPFANSPQNLTRLLYFGHGCWYYIANGDTFAKQYCFACITMHGQDILNHDVFDAMFYKTEIIDHGRLLLDSHF